MLETQQAAPAEAAAPAATPVQEQAANEQKVDTAAIEQAANAKNDEDFARKFAALSRQEKAIFQEKQRLKQEAEKFSKYQKLEDLKSKDPLTYIKELGLDLDSLVTAAVKQGEPPTAEDKIAQLEAKIKAFEEAENKKKQDLEAQKQVEIIDNFKKSIKDTVTAKPDEFELINLYGEYELIYDVVDAHFAKTQEVLPIEEAAKKVEEWLLEKAQKLSAAKKLGLKSEPAKQAEPPAEQKPQGFTLNSSVTPTSSASSSRLLSKEESIREAAKLIKFT